MLRIFVIFGAGYLLSSMLRGVTAALAPAFVHEFQLQPAQLGVLGGAYFLGFALMQLPAGAWLDRFGTRRVLAASLVVAAAGSYLFSIADSFAALVAARLACGIGVSACLIAPLTSARLWLSSARQQQVNLWLLMAGALGLLLATLPAQLVANLFGWRAIFATTALALVLVIVAILACVPGAVSSPATTGMHMPWYRAYAPVLRSPHTWKMVPLGFFSYAILVAVQTLWAGPWLTNVSGLSADAAAWGLFGINLVMLVVFLSLGFVTPMLIRSRAGAEGALRIGLPFGVCALVLIPIAGAQAGWIHFAAYCVASATLALTHPAVGQMFPTHLAGRAIAFFNLVLFLGVFAVQWGVGAVVEGVLAATGNVVVAYQAAFCVLAVLSLLSCLWFLGFDRLFSGARLGHAEESVL